MTTMTIGQGGALPSTATTLSGNNRACKAITLPVSLRLDSLSIFANTQSGNLTLGLYTNQNGTKPDQLLATTASTAMGAGLNTLAVLTPIVLPPGGYWIAAQIDNDVAIINSDTGGSGGWFYAMAYGAFDQQFNTSPTVTTTFLQAFATFTMITESAAAASRVNFGPGIRVRGRSLGPGKLESKWLQR